MLFRSLFPGNYTPYEHHISDQGGILNNPEGHRIFNLGVILTGILLIPYFLWLHRRLLPTTPPLSRLATLFSIIGCIGFCFVGIFPQDIKKTHDFAADIAFGGLGLGIFFTMFILARKTHLKGPWPNKFGFLAIYSLIFLIGGLAIYFQNYWDPGSIPVLDPRLSNDEPWQWTFFTLILCWIWVIYLVCTNEIDEKGKK